MIWYPRPSDPSLTTTYAYVYKYIHSIYIVYIVCITYIHTYISTIKSKMFREVYPNQINQNTFNILESFALLCSEKYNSLNWSTNALGVNLTPWKCVGHGGEIGQQGKNWTRGRNCKINVCSRHVLRGSVLSRNLTRRVEIGRGKQKKLPKPYPLLLSG